MAAFRCDVFLRFPLYSPHVVLVVGTYQGKTGRIARSASTATVLINLLYLF